MTRSRARSLSSACLMLVALALGVSTPAESSCHMCLRQVVDDCTALEADACRDSTTYAAQHMPGHAVEGADETKGYACSQTGDPPLCG